MGQKLLILLCIQLIALIGLTVGQQKLILPIRVTPPPPRPTPPPVSVPHFYNCTKYSTAKDYWVTFTYNGVNNNAPSRYCYLFPNVTTYAVSWHEAYDNCRRRGATLLSVHDFATNYILSHPLVLKYGNVLNNQYMGGVYWIGLNSLTGKRGDYRWSDRSPAQFHRWALTTSMGTPLPRAIRDQGRCVSMRVTSQSSQYKNYYNNTGLWFKDDCNLNHQYICQRNQTPPPPLPPLPTGGCPAGWFNANQKCIKHINKPLTFEQAKTTCNGMNAELLAIHTQQEQNFVTAMTAGLPTPYIGLTHPQSYYAWSWTDQSRVSYTNWGVQPPIYYYTQLNCVTLVTNSTQPGKWIRVACKEKHTVLCQMNRNPNIKQGIDMLSQKCNVTGLATGAPKFIQYKKSCYSMIEAQNKLSFIDAENHCKTLGANTHLVSIVDPYEQAFLKYFVQQTGKSAGYLIGLQSLAVSDTNDTQYFQWTDGWPIYYSNWMVKEPRVLRKPQNQCVALMKNTGTGNSWRTMNCTLPLPYICKISKNVPPKTRGAVNGVCPKLKGNTDKSLEWVNLHKGQQYCYWFSTERKGIAGSTGLQSWADASFHCRRRNGTLASIHSRHDTLILLQRLKNNPTFAQSTYYGSWIGLSSTIEGRLIWEDGTAVGYTSWAPGQRYHANSTNLNDDSGRICVELTPDGAWRQAACAGNKRDYFVCQTKKLFAPSTGSTSHAGRTAGIVIGVLLGIGALVALGIYISRRTNLKMPSVPSFDNPLSRSQRGMTKPLPHSHNNNSGSTMGTSSTNSDLTNSSNENPFVGKIIDT